MRYIFLTVDGVLNTAYEWKEKKYTVNWEKVGFLAAICKAYGASVVVTSNWSRGYYAERPEKSTAPFRELLRAFKKYDIPFAGVTPVLNNRRKEEEIKRFLMKNSGEYIILDNTIAGYTDKSRLFVIDHHHGLSKEKTVEIIKKLNPNYR